MSHYTQWLVEDRVIYTRVWGTFSAEEIPEVDAEMIPLLEQSDAPLIHVLADDLELESMPNMKKMSELQYVKHEKMGWFITSNPNRVLRFIGTVVGQLLKTRHRFVDSPEDGIDFLLTVDTTLPDKATLLAKLEEARTQAHADANRVIT